ncbi:glycosyltransferase family 2 protein [Pseudomonas marginalis]|uniref:glycosyltransferase family 2 protein n=2 Tax=Pseudomonas marginalis TaxID=298 RepID=UPI0009EF5DF3|nr:glycosyltransferase [Pseudomonas marginalis]
MDSDKYLVSIVIATHNRSAYAISCISSLLEIHSEHIQVVVHDTSNDECALARWVESNKNPRLVYVHWQERLSMTENHERAIALAQGHYVCLIGDDDTVSSYIVDVAKFAKYNNINMLTPKVKATYYWPDFRTKNYGSAHAGKIYVHPYDFKISCHDVSGCLKSATRSACQGTDGMPKLYHGLVSRHLLINIKKQNGIIFHGTSPDMSASVGLCLLGGTYHLLDFPFTMPGGGGNSNSGRSAVGKHKGELKNDPHLTPFKNLTWPEIIPSFFSVETVWAHAAWETLPEVDRYKRFNLSRLYALCLFNHSDYFKQTVRAFRKANELGNVSFVSLISEFFLVAKDYLKARIIRLRNPGPSNGSTVVGVVNDVSLARKKLDEFLTLKLNSRSVSDWLQGLKV